jgi:hypothetical protein
MSTLVLLSQLLEARAAPLASESGLGRVVVLRAPTTVGLEEVVQVLSAKAGFVSLRSELSLNLNTVDTLLCLLPLPSVGELAQALAPPPYEHQLLVICVEEHKLDLDPTPGCAGAWLDQLSSAMEGGPGPGGGCAVQRLFEASECIPCATDCTNLTPAELAVLQVENLCNVKPLSSHHKRKVLLFSPLRLRYALLALRPTHAPPPPRGQPCFLPRHLALIPQEGGAVDPYFPLGRHSGFVNSALGLWYQQRRQWKTPLPGTAADCAAARKKVRFAQDCAALCEVEEELKRQAPPFAALPRPVGLASVVSALADIWERESGEEGGGGVHEHST